MHCIMSRKCINDQWNRWILLVDCGIKQINPINQMDILLELNKNRCQIVDCFY
jgi:hypothetical protein